jgi:hypothetical protein
MFAAVGERGHNAAQRVSKMPDSTHERQMEGCKKMVTRPRLLDLSGIATAVLLCLAPAAEAQRATRIQLATLPNVQSELSLTEAQKKIASEASRKLIEERRQLFEEVRQDLDAMLTKMESLAATAAAQLTSQLSEDQKKRLTEIFVQANGASAVYDVEVAEQLNLSNEAKQQLTEVRRENIQSYRDAIQQSRDASDAERRETFQTVRRQTDERVLAVLSAEQRDQLEKLKGQPIELDLSEILPRPNN